MLKREKHLQQTPKQSEVASEVKNLKDFPDGIGNKIVVSQISVRESQKSSSLRGDRSSGHDDKSPKKSKLKSERSTKMTQPIKENDNDMEKD